ncbi:MAG: hypothetical protein V1702_03365 [Candidatus Woesearchaeota archaeon]
MIDEKEKEETIRRLIDVFEKLRISIYGRDDASEEIPKKDVTARDLADAIEKARRSICRYKGLKGSPKAESKDATIRDLADAIKRLREGIYGKRETEEV